MQLETFVPSARTIHCTWGVSIRDNSPKRLSRAGRHGIFRAIAFQFGNDGAWWRILRRVRSRAALKWCEGLWLLKKSTGFGKE
jgi:hypothetical protein